MSENGTRKRRPAPRVEPSIGGVVGLGVGVPLIAACGSDDEVGSGGAARQHDLEAPSARPPRCPFGGGKIFTADKVVVTQPTEGDFKAFSAVCTHQGCVVAEIVGQDIDCSCHGSRFSINDGSDARGRNNTPAGSIKPLEKLSVTVKGDDLVVS